MLQWMKRLNHIYLNFVGSLNGDWIQECECMQQVVDLICLIHMKEFQEEKFMGHLGVVYEYLGEENFKFLGPILAGLKYI